MVSVDVLAQFLDFFRIWYCALFEIRYGETKFRIKRADWESNI